MNRVAEAVDRGDGNIFNAKDITFDAGDGSKIVAVLEDSELGKDGGVVTTSTDVNDTKQGVIGVI